MGFNFALGVGTGTGITLSWNRAGVATGRYHNLELFSAASTGEKLPLVEK